MSLCNSHLLVSPQHSWDGSGSNSKRFSGSTHGRAIQEHLCYQCSTNGLLVPSTDSIKDGSSYCDAIHRFLKSSFKACSWAFPPSLSWLQKTQKNVRRKGRYGWNHIGWLWLVSESLLANVRAVSHHRWAFLKHGMTMTHFKEVESDSLSGGL